MLKRVLLAIAIILKLVTLGAQAQEGRDLDLLLQNDRDERIARINELTIELNKSLVELKALEADLNKALRNEKESHAIKASIRNGSMAIAAIGFIGTFLYQTHGIIPAKFMLGAGYTLSTLALAVGLLEQRSIQFSRVEVEKIRASVNELKKRAEIEKINLSKEIRLLCLEDGGTPDTCELFRFQKFSDAIL